MLTVATSRRSVLSSLADRQRGTIARYAPSDRLSQDG